MKVLKKNVSLTFILLFTLMLGCNSKNATSQVQNTNINNKAAVIKDAASESISDYYPLKENARYVYTGEGMEYASSNIYVDFIKDNKIQERIINGGTTAGQVFEIKNGELRMLDSVGEFYYRDDLTEGQGQMADILLKEPLVTGTSWLSSTGKKKYINSTDAEVTVPYGTFKTIEVVTEDGDSKIYDYYAKNVGVVKRIFNFKDSKITVSLEKILEDAKIDQTIKFYYPEYNKNLIVYKKIKISLKTNEQIKDYFEKYFKEKPIADASVVLSKKTKINKLYLNRDENKVYVDFSADFAKDMNLGSTAEAMTLQVIANTLGDYYNVDKVHITVDGKDYESDHIVINEKNPAKVNLENTMEIK
jgi:hypothetical protein